MYAVSSSVLNATGQGLFQTLPPYTLRVLPMHTKPAVMRMYRLGWPRGSESESWARVRAGLVGVERPKLGAVS